MLFSQRESPLKNYSATIRLDTREIPYCDAIGAAAHWLGELPGNNPLPVPETAREPFYSTWYSYHHNVFAGELEKECELAAQYGMKGIILDGGW